MSSRILTISLLLAPIFILSVSDVKSEDYRILKVGIDRNPPVSIPVSEHKAIGFYPEILEDIAQKEKWTISYTPCSGRSCCKMLDSGEVDLVIGSPWSKKRTALYDFSATGIIKNWGQIIGRKDQMVTLRNMTALQDLSGKTIAGVTDDTLYEKLKDQLFVEGVDAKTIDLADNSQVILTVAGKGVDFGVLSRFYASRAKTIWNEVGYSNLLVSPTPLGIASLKGNEKEVQARIDYWINIFKEDNNSIYHKAYQHWLAPLDKTPLPKWMYWVSALTGAGFIFGFTHLWVLRRQVKKRTAALSAEIEARTEAEKNLLSEKETLEAVFDSLPGRAFVADSTGKLVRWNKFFYEVGGWDQETLIGSFFIDHIAEEDQQKASAQLSRLFTGENTTGKIVSECMTITRNGSKIPMLCAATLRTLDGEQRVIGIGVDISSQKEAEQNYLAIFNSVSDALLVFNKNGILFDANTQACTMFGENKADLIQKGMSAICLKDAPYREIDWLNQIEKEYEKETPRVISWCSMNKKGGLIQAEVALRITVIGGDKLIVCSFRDVTDRKKLEEFIEQQKKMDCVGLFASGVAHDFNNVLSPILVYGELLKNESLEGSLSSNYANNLLEAGNIAKKLASDLVGVFRKDSGSASFFDINKQILTLHQFLQKSAGDVKVELDLFEAPCFVMGFVSRIEQILLNFTVNARDALTGRTDGLITIKTDKIKILENDQAYYGAVDPGEYIRMAFTDNGSGMSDETKARIFEPFFTTKSSGQGTGLGMATVYNAIQENRGGIHIESQIGTCTCFEVVLPKCTDPC